MPRACPVEGSRSLLCSLKRETPLDKPVASHIWGVEVLVAAIVKLHGTSPWHLFLNLLDQPQGVVAGDEGDVFVGAEILQEFEQLTWIGERIALQ